MEPLNGSNHNYTNRQCVKSEKQTAYIYFCYYINYKIFRSITTHPPLHQYAVAYRGKNHPLLMIFQKAKTTVV